MASTLTLDWVQRSQHQLVFNYRVDDLHFHTVYWYDSVNFYELEKRWGTSFLNRIYFHLAAFEANKAVSLKVDTFDPGPYRMYCTAAFADLWSTVFENVWAVWRYENGITDYRLPRVLFSENGGSDPISMPRGETDSLCLVGGGKDSLVSTGLLEAAKIDYDTFVYSHNIYGRASSQHELISRMLAHCQPRRQHRGWVYDNALDSPACIVHPERGVKSMLSAETVSSYFASLPVALQNQNRNILFGITKSTDEHNLHWEETGENVNYLWGMSSEAERRIFSYVKRELVDSINITHLLRSVYDLVVFNLLEEKGSAIIDTHSCAREKPWCYKCPKCVYVWMHYAAWLEPEQLQGVFEKSVFEIASNKTILRKMLGLEGYKPCDCVGTVSETRLAFLLCLKRGYRGTAIEGIDSTHFEKDWATIVEKYSPVFAPSQTILPELFQAISPHLRRGSERIVEIAQSHLLPIRKY